MQPMPPKNPPPQPRTLPPSMRPIGMNGGLGLGNRVIPPPPPRTLPKVGNHFMRSLNNQTQPPPPSMIPLPPKVPGQNNFNNMIGLGKRLTNSNAPLMQLRPNKRLKMKMSKIDEKVKKAKQSAKIKFALGNKAKKNLMEDYLEESAIYNSFFPPFYNRNLDSNLAKETRMRIKEMKTNPQNFFNFGRFFIL